MHESRASRPRASTSVVEETVAAHYHELCAFLRSHHFLTFDVWDRTTGTNWASDADRTGRASAVLSLPWQMHHRFISLVKAAVKRGDAAFSETTIQNLPSDTKNVATAVRAHLASRGFEDAIVAPKYVGGGGGKCENYTLMVTRRAARDPNGNVLAEVIAEMPKAKICARHYGTIFQFGKVRVWTYSDWPAFEFKFRGHDIELQELHQDGMCPPSYRGPVNDRYDNARPYLPARRFPTGRKSGEETFEDGPDRSLHPSLRTVDEHSVSHWFVTAISDAVRAALARWPVYAQRAAQDLPLRVITSSHLSDGLESGIIDTLATGRTHADPESYARVFDGDAFRIRKASVDADVPAMIPGSSTSPYIRIAESVTDSEVQGKWRQVTSSRPQLEQFVNAQLLRWFDVHVGQWATGMPFSQSYEFVDAVRRELSHCSLIGTLPSDFHQLDPLGLTVSDVFSELRGPHMGQNGASHIFAQLGLRAIGLRSEHTSFWEELFPETYGIVKKSLSDSVAPA